MDWVITTWFFPLHPFARFVRQYFDHYRDERWPTPGTLTNSLLNGNEKKTKITHKHKNRTSGTLTKLHNTGFQDISMMFTGCVVGLVGLLGLFGLLGLLGFVSLIGCVGLEGLVGLVSLGWDGGPDGSGGSCWSCGSCRSGALCDYAWLGVLV